MNNIQKELNYMSNDLTESELRKSTNITLVNSIISLKENNNTVNFDGDNNLNQISPSENFSNTEFAITVNNNHDTNREIGLDITPIQEQPLDLANLNYDPNNVENDLNGLDFKRDAFLNPVFGLGYEEGCLPELGDTFLNLNFGMGYKGGRLPEPEFQLGYKDKGLQTGLIQILNFL
ncbi:hypothetical protein RhiirA1_472661 [Rhizophagus irregularis]|uniref:Uncharacterized protein n=1 Tax=Rhizophagus irregularis TaxID=588596 RepID=A0A2N0R202_9GLOM|nr:hypothetical protein RhiirA1_472661 [Rhizophagus irregularis]